MNQSVKRYDFIDILKGLAIIVVLAGHSFSAFPWGYHMPVFFFASGIFLSNKLAPREFIIKRARQLLVPYAFGVILTTIGSIIRNLFANSTSKIIFDIKKWILAGLYGQGTKGDFLVPGIKKIGALWFLLALFIAGVIVVTIINTENKYLLLITLLLAYAGVCTRETIRLPLSIQPALLATFFLAVGVYYKKSGIIDHKPRPELFVCSILFAILCIKSGITMSAVNCRTKNFIVCIMCALSVIYIFICVSKWINSYLLESSNKGANRLASLFVWLGKYSMVTYFIHACELNIFPWNFIIKNVAKLIPSLSSEWEMFILRAAIIPILTAIVLKIKPIRNILLPGSNAAQKVHK